MMVMMIIAVKLFVDSDRQISLKDNIVYKRLKKNKNKINKEFRCVRYTRGWFFFIIILFFNSFFD